MISSKLSENLQRSVFLGYSRYSLVLQHDSSAVLESILISISANQGFNLGISVQVSELLA